MKKKIYLATIGIFLLGFIAGGLSTGLYLKYRMKQLVHGGPEFRKAFVLKRLSHFLDLNDSQQKEVKKIVDHSHIRVKQFRKQHEPTLKNIMDECVASIMKELNPEQQQKLQKEYETLQKKLKHWEIPNE